MTLKINNKTISKHYGSAKNCLQKTLGLMFRFKVKKPLIFFFREETIIPLHMFFVFCPIDVLFLNSKKQIIEIKENFLPFTFYTPKRQAKYIIELPDGWIRKYKIKQNHKASF